MLTLDPRGEFDAHPEWGASVRPDLRATGSSGRCAVGFRIDEAELPLSLVTEVLRRLAFNDEPHISAVKGSPRWDEQRPRCRPHPLPHLLHHLVSMAGGEGGPPLRCPDLDRLGECYQGRIEGAAPVQLDSLCILERQLGGAVVTFLVADALASAAGGISCRPNCLQQNLTAVGDTIQGYHCLVRGGEKLLGVHAMFGT
jgi:hypothetical protein